MDRSSLLRKALLGNAAFSTLCGVEMLFAPEAVARFIGFSQPGELRELGISLLLFAAFLTLTATRKVVRVWAAGIFTAMDVAWVVGTAALLVARPDAFNTTGVVAAIVVALVVGDFAFFQVLGIRRLTRGAGEGEHESARPALSSEVSAS